MKILELNCEYTLSKKTFQAILANSSSGNNSKISNANSLTLFALSYIQSWARYKENSKKKSESHLCCACCSRSRSTFSSPHSAWSRGRTGTSTSHRSCPAYRGHGPCRRWWRALLDFRSPPPSCRIVKPSGGYRPRFCSRLRYFESFHTLEQIDYTFLRWIFVNFGM